MSEQLYKCEIDELLALTIMWCVPPVSAAGHEASEGDGAAREKPERAGGETGEVQ